MTTIAGEPGKAEGDKAGGEGRRKGQGEPGDDGGKEDGMWI